MNILGKCVWLFGPSVGSRYCGKSGRVLPRAGTHIYIYLCVYVNEIMNLSIFLPGFFCRIKWQPVLFVRFPFRFD